MNEADWRNYEAKNHISSFYSNFVLCRFCPRAEKLPTPKPKVLGARDIAAKVLPSVVLIITQDENGKPIAQGSGFVFKSGLVVSNLLVFERATSAFVKSVKTGEVSKITAIVGMNAKQDICIFRIDNQRLPSLPLGDSYAVRTGDEVYVASNPKGLEGSFTKGIVSSVRENSRTPRFGNDSERNANLFINEILGATDRTLIQIDAAVSPGSSGGVLISTRGGAIGVVRSSLESGQNLNFAIPIEQVKATPLKFNHSVQLAGACGYSDRKKEGLVGPVRTLREMDTPKKAGSSSPMTDTLIATSSNSYDIAGNLIEWTLYDASTGAFGVQYQYKYDESGIVNATTTSYASGKVETLPYDLDSGVRFKLAVRKFSQNFGEIDQPGGMRVFDSSGRVVTWYLSGTIQKNVYDDRSRLIGKSQLRNGVVERISRYEYAEDSHGNWIQQRSFACFPNSPGVDPNRWFEEEPPIARLPITKLNETITNRNF